MQINCVYDSATNNYDCNFPDVVEVLTERSDFLTSVQVADKDFEVDEITTYGDLTISFLLFLILLVLIFNIIVKFFITDTIRIKKHELWLRIF